MIRKLAISSLSLALSLGTLLPLNPANASSEWPLWSPDANSTNTFDNPGSSNALDMDYFVDNTSGTGIYFLEFKMLGFVLNMNDPGMKTANPSSPTVNNKFSFNGSGGPAVSVWMDQGAIAGYEVTSNSYIFYLNNWTGRFNLRVHSQELISGNNGSSFAFFGIDQSTNAVYTNTQMWPSSGGGGSIPSGGSATAPAKYSGPEFSGVSATGIMAGTSPRLEGKNLDEISSITIGGKAATFTLDGDKALDLTLPEGLAPGLYDLVINSSAGKLSHINAIRVREPLKSFSITSRSIGKISEEQYQEHAIISSMQIPELNKARCIVNGSNLAQAKAQAERLCALVAAANPNIETTVVEARSTVKSNAVFARVTYGWN